MAGLDPATQQPRVGAANDPTIPAQRCESFRLANARRLDGRVKPGHGE
jgi:hypothetical protein